MEIIYKNIKKNKILVLLSQVPPGFTDNIKWNSNKLYYQVETLVFGNAIERALKPERIIIGKNTKQVKINKNLINYYKLFTNKHIIMSYKSAELTKNFELGIENDLTKVMIQQQLASLGFQMTLNVRNKVLSAYKDIMNMPV